MNSKELDLLRERWSDSESKYFSEGFSKGKADRSPFGEIDGRQDFRGFPLQRNVRYRGLEGFDFTGLRATKSGMFTLTSAVDCIFDFADGIPNLGDSFIACRFRHANFRNSYLTGLFHNCDFSEAVMRQAHGGQSRYINCNFTNSDLKGAVIIRSTFLECLFIGTKFFKASLADSVFKTSRPTEDQLRGVILDGCRFEPA